MLKLIIKGLFNMIIMLGLILPMTWYVINVFRVFIYETLHFLNTFRIFLGVYLIHLSVRIWPFNIEVRNKLKHKKGLWRKLWPFLKISNAQVIKLFYWISKCDFILVHIYMEKEAYMFPYSILFYFLSTLNNGFINTYAFVCIISTG